MKLKKWNGSAWVQDYPEVNVSSIVATGTPSSTTFLRGDGTWAVPNGVDNYVNTTGDTMSGQLTSTVATGTAPFVIASTTRVSNLNVATAGTADTLTTGRTINVSTGATGTATSFNGSANISIPITGVSEAYLTWGGKSLSDQVTPIGMALSNEHSANRLAFINGDSLYFEYSSDGGSTWTDYGYSASIKSQVCTTSTGILIGRTSGEYTTSSRTRITLTAQNGTTGYVYTNPKKMLINISSSGGMNVLVEYRSGTNYQSSGAWTTFGTYSLIGWSGWNDIPLILGTLGGGTTQTGNNWQLRLTFIMTSKDVNYPTTAQLNAIRIFGENAWQVPSTLAGTNNLYSYDMSQNATFPGNLLGATVRTTQDGSAGAPGIGFSQDTNTGLFRPAEDTLAFAEGGTEAMRINSSGNLGLGTTNPQVKLHVVGGTRITGQLNVMGDAETKRLWVDYEDGNDLGTIQVIHDGTAYKNLALQPDGNNVGIGTRTPGEKLEVSGNAKATTFISTQATGTAPLTVASTTAVTNLNADLLDGNHAAAFATSTHTHGNISNAGGWQNTPQTIASGDTFVITKSGLLNNASLAFGTGTTTYLRNDGTWGTPAGSISGSGTANQITYWTGTSSLGALSTATYPSLTELSYVKGVTSGIQTQLAGKANSLHSYSTGTVITSTTYSDTGISFSLEANAYYMIVLEGGWNRTSLSSVGYRQAVVFSSTAGSPNIKGHYMFQALRTSTSNISQNISVATTTSGTTDASIVTTAATTSVTNAPITGLFYVYAGSSAVTLKFTESASVALGGADEVGFRGGAIAFKLN